MYVDPIDLPLIEKKQEVRIQFDGWPAIVFSGWPNTSYGTYGGRVFAIDNFISNNGKYRLMVSPDPNDHPWPDALRVGAGTFNMLLLKDVPIWYELWRQINGFPPDYYKNDWNTEVNKMKK
jgi:membrane fusion protein, adhesin transport system